MSIFNPTEKVTTQHHKDKLNEMMELHTKIIEQIFDDFDTTIKMYERKIAGVSYAETKTLQWRLKSKRAQILSHLRRLRI